ncbi:MAG TPA: discoidin domain-containing protein [Polyangiaceae bacterium]
MSLVCDPKSLSCATASCSDGVLNGSESAIDCGTGCMGCATGQACTTGQDCDSGLCKSDVCVPASPSGAKLSRNGWVVSASSSDMNGPPSNAIDGDPSSRWSSGIEQAPGIWFKLDMQQPQLFFSIVLDTRFDPNDAPVMFDVFLSNDDKFRSPTKSGLQGAPLTTVDFGSAQLVRYVYFRLRGTKAATWWSIHELNAYR